MFAPKYFKFHCFFLFLQLLYWHEQVVYLIKYIEMNFLKFHLINKIVSVNMSFLKMEAKSLMNMYIMESYL